MNDYRVIAGRRLPTKLPITQTALIVTMVKVFEVESPWTYVIAAMVAAAWVIAGCLLIVERKVDPFGG